MPALDPLAKLKALTKTESGASTFAHESEDEVLRQLLGVFAKVPTGKELVDKSKEYNIAIKLLKGKNDFSYSPETNTVFLGLPAGQTAPKARMLLHLAMGLEEARQEFEGLPRPDTSYAKQHFIQINMEKQRHILFNLCKIAEELENSLGLREVVDELDKMGHTEFYKAYLEDLDAYKEKKV